MTAMTATAVTHASAPAMIASTLPNPARAAAGSANGKIQHAAQAAAPVAAVSANALAAFAGFPSFFIFSPRSGMDRSQQQ